MSYGDVFINFDEISDKRYKNYLLALNMFVKELIDLEYDTFGDAFIDGCETNKRLAKILDKYNIEIIKKPDGTESVGIDFPAGVEREQVFKDVDGTYITRIVK